VAIGVAAMALFGALPAVASATDYCVVPNVGCGGTNVDTLQKALADAASSPDADRIFLGAFNYVAPTTAGFDYSKSGPPVEIVGKGAGQTVLTAPSGGTSVLRLFGNAGSSVHDLRVRMPENAALDAAGLSTDGVARRIDVIDAPQQLDYRRQGVHLENGGVLEGSSVMLDGLRPTGVWIDVGGGSVRGSTIVGYSGIASAHGATVEGSLIVSLGGALGAGGGLTTVKNSVIRLGQAAYGLVASAQPGSSATITADGLTIVGPGHLSSRAVAATTMGSPADNAYVNVTNSIIRGGTLAANGAGTGHATITVSYSDLAPLDDELYGANANISRANVTNVGDARFADPLLGDYHLLSNSPLIDAGDPAAGAGTDMDGKPRLVDGNADGTARRDMGAFEYQTGLPDPGAPPPPPPAGDAGGATPPVDTQAPLIGGFRATPSLFSLARASTPVAARVAHGTRFRYTLSEPAQVKLTLQRALPGRRSGGRCVAPSPRLREAKRCTRYATVGALRRSGAKGTNAVRFSGRIGKRALRPGRYRARISATDTAGNRSGLRSAAFRIARG
jgi:hypothetical protein